MDPRAPRLSAPITRPYTQLTAEATRDLRRPIAAAGMDSPWLRVGDADAQLRITRAGKPYLDARSTKWLERMYRAWLTRAGRSFGEPLPHAPAPAIPGIGEPLAEGPRGAANGAARGGATGGDTANAHPGPVSPPEIPDVPETPGTKPASRSEIRRRRFVAAISWASARALAFVS